MKASILKNPETLANDGSFDEAISLIDDALQIIPVCQTLQVTKNDLTPKYLVDTVNATSQKIIVPG